MNLFKEYMKEREGAEVIDDHTGFIAYKFDGDYCFITDIFVSEKHRRSDAGSKFGSKVEKIAKEKGYNKMMCAACINANNVEDAVKFIKSNGYKMSGMENSMIYFVKDI